MEISYKRLKFIENCANYYHKKYRTRNALMIFENSPNIEYSSIDLVEELVGFTYKRENRKKCFYVYVDRKYDNYSKKIIAAHELGHILLHGDGLLNAFVDDETHELKEYEANVFAMEFMPQIRPRNMDWKDMSAQELQNYICNKLCIQK